MDMECLEYKKKIWEGTRDGYGVFRTQEKNMGGNKRLILYIKWMVDMEWIQDGQDTRDGWLIWNGNKMDRIQEMDG